jgi:hypothetical protein
VELVLVQPLDHDIVRITLGFIIDESLVLCHFSAPIGVNERKMIVC